MALSKVAICNMALGHIGASSTLESIDEPSAAAASCRLWYDHSRLVTLAAHDWNFARKRQILPLHAEAAPEPEWLFRYQYPADCVVGRRVPSPATVPPFAPFAVEADSTGTSQCILTNMEQATLIYTFDQTSVAMFSNVFIELLSFQLAHHIAFTITGKREIKADMLDAYQMLLATAPSSNANEGAEGPPADADWIRARGGMAPWPY